MRGPHRRHPRHPERLSHQRVRGRPVPGQALRRRAPPPGAGPALRRRPQRHHRSAGRGGQLRLVHDRLQHPPRIRQRRPHQLSGWDGHVPQPEAFCRRLRQPEDAPLPFRHRARNFIQHGAGRPSGRLCGGVLGVHQRREPAALPGQRLRSRVHPRPPGPFCGSAPPAHRDTRFRGPAA